MRNLGENIRVRCPRDAGAILGVGSHIQLDITNLGFFGGGVGRGLFIQALNTVAVASKWFRGGLNGGVARVHRVWSSKFEGF